MEYIIHSSTGELYHHGVKGQKWGVRRYQKENGSYTSAGRKHRKQYSEDAERIRNLKKKKPYELSNKELQDIQNRENLENFFKNSKKSAGRKFVDKTMGKIGEKASEKIAKAVVAAGAAAVATYILGNGGIKFPNFPNKNK